MQCPRNSLSLKLWRNGHEQVCSAYLNSGAASTLCKKKAHILVGGGPESSSAYPGSASCLPVCFFVLEESWQLGGWGLLRNSWWGRPLPRHPRGLLAAQDGAGPVGGGGARTPPVLVLARPEPDAAGVAPALPYVVLRTREVAGFHWPIGASQLPHLCGGTGSTLTACGEELRAFRTLEQFPPTSTAGRSPAGSSRIRLVSLAFLSSLPCPSSEQAFSLLAPSFHRP